MRIHRCFVVLAVAGLVLIATAVPALPAPPASSWYVDISSPSSYPSCTGRIGVDFGWAHLGADAQSKNVFVVVFIVENGSTELLRYAKVAPSAHGKRSFLFPTRATDSFYAPNWDIDVIIYPGTDTSSPAIRYSFPSPINVEGCTAL